MEARRHGPLKLTRLPDCTSGQRALYLAMKAESVHPTVRLRFFTFGVFLAVSVAVGFILGRNT
jgi:hypothetical protein